VLRGLLLKEPNRTDVQHAQVELIFLWEVKQVVPLAVLVVAVKAKSSIMLVQPLQMQHATVLQGIMEPWVKPQDQQLAQLVRLENIPLPRERLNVQAVDLVLIPIPPV